MSSNKNLSIQTIVFHWLTGLMFLVIFAIGYSFDYLARGPEKMQLMGIHKSLGVIFLFLAALRLWWRAKEGKLPALGEQSALQRKLATGVQHLLLLLTLLMPISGMIMSIGGGRGIDVFGVVLINSGDKIPLLATIGSTIHGVSVTIIIIALILHVAGALKHQLIDKNGIISRMLGRKI